MSATSAKMELLNYLVDSFKQAKTLAEENDTLRARVAELEEAHRWIPVTERLPEDHDTVLFYCRSNYSNIGYHVESAKQWTALPGFYYHGKMYKLITHWQPLPASPEDANA